MMKLSKNVMMDAIPKVPRKTNDIPEVKDSAEGLKVVMLYVFSLFFPLFFAHSIQKDL